MVVRGKLVPDAHLATLLRQHGVRILYLRWGSPPAAGPDAAAPR